MNISIEKIEFTKLENIEYEKLFNIYKNCDYQLEEHCLGTHIMWNELILPEYYIDENIIIVKYTENNEEYFLYPYVYNVGLEKTDENYQKILDEYEEKALLIIENYCMQNDIGLKLYSIPKNRLEKLISRYPYFESETERLFKEYVYLSSDLIDLKGRVMHKKKNKLLQFDKEYENISFRRLKKEDKNIIEEFFIEYENKITKEKTEDVLEEIKLAKHMFSLLEYDSLIAGGLFDKNKLIGIILGEICANTLITHIEKAFYEYDGIYVKLMNEYYKMFATNVMYVNREEDANDKGLRQAKYSYNPAYLLDEYTIKSVNKFFDNVDTIPQLQSERLKFRAFSKEIEEGFIEICKNETINKYYGENTLDDCKQMYEEGLIKNNSLIFLYDYYFDKKIAMPFAIYYNEDFAGEVILYNYDFKGNIEIGIRINQKFMGQHIATESINRICDYALYTLGFFTVKARVFKENEISNKLFDNLMTKYDTDDKFNYYYRKL